MTSDTPVGILPGHQICELVAAGAIAATAPLDADQIQPASLDLRLGDDRLSRPRELPARSRHDGRRPARRR